MKNICPICNEPFEAIRNGKIYCSDRCRKQAFLERQGSETAGTNTEKGNGNIQKNSTPDKNGSNNNAPRTQISNETKNKTVPVNVGELTYIIKNTVRDAVQDVLQAVLKNKKTQRIAEDEHGTTEEEQNENEAQDEKENDNEIINDRENGTEAENDFLHQNDESSETNEESDDEDSDQLSQEESMDEEENGNESETEDENDANDENDRENDDNGTDEPQEKNDGNNYISKSSFAIIDKISVNDSIGKNNLIEDYKNENGKKNGTLSQNDSGNESFTKASTGTLFGNDKNDIKENGILPGTLMQDAGANKEWDTAVLEEKYKPVNSVFLDSIGDLVNGTDLKERLASPKKNFPADKILTIKSFTTYYRCLLENTLRLSQYSSVASEDLRLLIRGFDYLLRQPHLMAIADQCGYEEVVIALHEELCKIHRRHRGKNQLRLVLTTQWKIDAIACLHEIGESVPLLNFKKLFGNILQIEK